MQALPTQPLFETVREAPPTKYPAVRAVYDAAEASELLHAVETVLTDGGRRLALGEIFVRSLRTPEIHHLERQGNTAEDWSPPGRMHGAIIDALQPSASPQSRSPST